MVSVPVSEGGTVTVDGRMEQLSEPGTTGHIGSYEEVYIAYRMSEWLA